MTIQYLTNKAANYRNAKTDSTRLNCLQLAANSCQLNLWEWGQPWTPELEEKVRAILLKY